MDNNTLAIYIHELRNQCLHTQASFDLLNQAITTRNPNAVLYSGQMILMPGSQISALLWPTRARSRTRGEALRKVLQLPERHPLNNRHLSELWERADEKTEEWIAATKGKHVIFDFVGDPAELGDGQTPEECIFRAYHPGTNVYYYRGVGYNLKAVADAISDIGARVTAVYRKMFPEQVKREQEMMEASRKADEEAQAQAAAAAATEEKPAAKKPAAKKAPAKKAAPKKAAAKKAS